MYEHIDLSIIIVSYNTASITKNCLESIWKSLALSDTNFSWEIIVVDNNSTDDSVKVLQILEKKKENNLKVIANTTNLGYGTANNQAVKKARGAYILLLNSDIEVVGTAIPTLFEFIKDKGCDFVGGKLLNSDQTPQFSCGPFYTLPLVFTQQYLRGDYLGITRYSPQYVKKVDWISGACIMGNKKSFQTLDGFDENIFMYFEEIDLFYRANKHNMSVYFYPKAQFIHLEGASSGKRSYQIEHVYAGFVYFYRKHYGKAQFFLLKILLQLKARVAILLGHITKNEYLTTTYEKAIKRLNVD